MRRKLQIIFTKSCLLQPLCCLHMMSSYDSSLCYRYHIGKNIIGPIIVLKRVDCLEFRSGLFRLIGGL
jgi:hypothetical protein